MTFKTSEPLYFAAVIFGTIIATGALLNLAGKGAFGKTVENGAKYVTEGYGT